jgi:HEAT repeat protein
VRKFLAYLLFLAVLAIGAAWYVQGGLAVPTTTAIRSDVSDDRWLSYLYSQNPHEAKKAAGQVRRLGARALPTIRAALQDPQADAERRKAALKACGILGPRAAPVTEDVATHLANPELTAEAAVALSFMGPQAFRVLRDALSSEDPSVRREALRSIGKLKFRAPLDVDEVITPLVHGMGDPDPSVRTVAATYLGILHEVPERSVPSLIVGLSDPHVEVRRAAATALGSFSSDAAQPALPELRKAAGDRDEDLAREAGRTLIKLQHKQ